MIIVAVDAHFDLSTLETMASRIMGMKDEMDGNKIQVVEDWLVEGAGLVVAVLQAIHMGGDECIPRQSAFIETFLVDLKALFGNVLVFGWCADGASSLAWHIFWFPLWCFNTSASSQSLKPGAHHKRDCQ